MENMFDLLHEEQEVIDAPGAGSLIVRRGQVEFRNVSFGYLPEKLVLKNISFSVPEGKTVALVRGSKYTLRIRFYTENNGSFIVGGTVR